MDVVPRTADATCRIPVDENAELIRENPFPTAQQSRNMV
jgi:hypothetical protein